MNNWLNNEPTETSPEITFADLKRAEEAAYQRGFQDGGKFAMSMLSDDTDFEPTGTTRVCLSCYATEYLTDAEAEEKGWASDACGECVKGNRFMEVVDIRDTPYFQKNLAPVRKSERIGGIKVA